MCFTSNHDMGHVMSSVDRQKSGGKPTTSVWFDKIAGSVPRQDGNG